MSHSQFHSIELFILTHAWLNLWDKRMTTGRINQVNIFLKKIIRPYSTYKHECFYIQYVGNHFLIKKVLKPIVVFSSTIVVERNSVQASFLNFFKKTNLFTQFNFILQNWSSFPRICNAQLIHSFSQWEKTLFKQ